MPELWRLPQDSSQLIQFYVVVCFIYMSIHFIWDFLSAETPPFSLKNMKFKVDVIYSGATLASSLFFLLVIFDLNNLLRSADIFMMPMILSGFSGILLSLANLVPGPQR